MNDDVVKCIDSLTSLVISIHKRHTAMCQFSSDTRKGVTVRSFVSKRSFKNPWSFSKYKFCNAPRPELRLFFVVTIKVRELTVPSPIFFNLLLRSASFKQRHVFLPPQVIPVVGQRQCRLTRLVPCVHVGATFDQRLHDFRGTVSCSGHQQRLSSFTIS